MNDNLEKQDYLAAKALDQDCVSKADLKQARQMKGAGQRAGMALRQVTTGYLQGRSAGHSSVVSANTSRWCSPAISTPLPSTCDVQ